jgi:hypothetical protein
MSETKQLEIPEGLAELLQNPQRVEEAFETLNLLLTVRVQLTQPSTTRGVASLVTSGERYTLPIPLQLAAPIANSTATAASVNTQFNALLQAMRVTGQLPT